MGYDEVLFSDATDRIDRLLSETFGIALSLHRSGMPMLCQRGKLGPSSLHLLMACFPISRKASEPQVADAERVSWGSHAIRPQSEQGIKCEYQGMGFP